MVDLDESIVAYLTELCRIGLTKEESRRILKDLKRMLDFVEMLQEVDTDDVEPTYHIFPDIINVMREDVEGEIMERETFLEGAPHAIAGMVKVPPVLQNPNN